jgi:hypothetical protein
VVAGEGQVSGKLAVATGQSSAAKGVRMKWIARNKPRPHVARSGEKPDKSPDKPIWLQAYEATVPLVQALVWPTILLFFVYQLREPLGKMSCPPNFVFQGSMVSIETGRTKSAEDSEARVHG